MTTAKAPTVSRQTAKLAPSYKIPFALVIGALPLLLWQPIISLVVSVFGCFLLLQAVTIRLEFTPTALDIYRSEKLIRRFPYQDWQNWQIFWQPVPILFYFREVKSIHFLPIIFDPQTLKACLETHVPPQDKN